MKQCLTSFDVFMNPSNTPRGSVDCRIDTQEQYLVENYHLYCIRNQYKNNHRAGHAFLVRIEVRHCIRFE